MIFGKAQVTSTAIVTIALLATTASAAPGWGDFLLEARSRELGKKAAEFTPDAIKKVNSVFRNEHATQDANSRHAKPSPAQQLWKKGSSSGAKTGHGKRDSELLEARSRELGKKAAEFTPDAIKKVNSVFRNEHATQDANSRHAKPSPAQQLWKKGSNSGAKTGHGKRDSELLEARSRELGKKAAEFTPDAIKKVNSVFRNEHATQDANSRHAKPSPAQQLWKKGSNSGAKTGHGKRDLVDALADYLVARAFELDDLEERGFGFDELDERGFEFADLDELD